MHDFNGSAGSWEKQSCEHKRCVPWFAKFPPPAESVQADVVCRLDRKPVLVKPLTATEVAAVNVLL